MIPARHLEALREIVRRLKDRPIDWAVTGSLGMALQGVPVKVDDIDLQTDRDGAHEIERCCAGCVSEPVRFSEADRIRSHLGRLVIAGVPVEIMGDVQKRLDDGGWEEPVRVERHGHWVQVDSMRVLVLSLEYEYRAYRGLGRTEKADMLRAWLQRDAGGAGPPA